MELAEACIVGVGPVMRVFQVSNEEPASGVAGQSDEIGTAARIAGVGRFAILFAEARVM